jgi:thioredoxin-like negative regulator of GroEL
LKHALESDANNLSIKYELATELSKNSFQEEALTLLLEVVLK